MTTADFRAGIEAAVALLFGKPGALGRFDVSLEGFWRSFAAIVLVLPSFAISLMAVWRGQMEQLPAEAVDVPWLGFVLERVVSLGLAWVALPLVLALIAGRLGLSGRYVPFIVARNWAEPVVSAFYAVPALFYAAGFIDSDVAAFISLPVLFVALHYLYRIARQTLGATISLAIGVVVLDLLLGLLVSETVSRLWPA
ncbi:hypothetical protein RUR49_13570 [Pseudoxanthobacter sp. M-2]|uniref:hypothetical protein n=1 Tax=Pseudoxanthobacter sp. M-2 TaxID=3078754 RepID=UPI0038FBF20A